MTQRRAVAELVASALLFGLSAWIAKRATGTLSGSEVAFLRFAIGFVFAFAQSWVRGAPLRFRRYDLLLLRGFFGATAGLLYFLALAEIPVGTATLLNCTSPLFTALFAVLFLHERLGGQRALAMLLAAGGVALVVIGQGVTFGGALGWQMAALASGVLAGGAVATIRAARRYNGPWELFVFFNGMGMLATGPFAFPTWVWPDAATWGIVAAMGLVLVAAQLLMNSALGHAEASVAAALVPLTPVTSFALGIAFDGELVTALSVSGGVLTLLGVTWIARLGSAAPKPPPPAPTPR